MVEYVFKHPDSGINLSDVMEKRVALFGIGTGLGHAIADVDCNANLNFVTDGHASKLLVPVTGEDDIAFIQEAMHRMNISGKREIAIIDQLQPDGTSQISVRAEDLMRDPMLKAMCGVKDCKDIDLTNPEHLRAVQFVGKYMARLIDVIRSGSNDDITDSDVLKGQEKNGWFAEDKKQAALTQVYLIGGGLGGSPLSAKIIEEADKELGNLGISDNVKLIQFTGPNQAPRFAATMVSSSHYIQAAASIA